MRFTAPWQEIFIAGNIGYYIEIILGFAVYDFVLGKFDRGKKIFKNRKFEHFLFRIYTFIIINDAFLHKFGNLTIQKIIKANLFISILSVFFLTKQKKSP